MASGSRRNFFGRATAALLVTLQLRQVASGHATDDSTCACLPSRAMPSARERPLKCAHAQYQGKPLFSAVIHAFRAPVTQPAHLVRGLRAAHPSMEIIVADDSHENSAAWIAALNGPNDFYAATPDLHEIRSYNRIASMARGEYLIVMQADYCLPPGDRSWLNNTLALFEHIPLLGLLGGLSCMIGQDAKQFSTPRRWGSQGGPVTTSTLSMPFMYCQAANLGPFVARRKAFLQVGGFDESFSCPGDPGIGLDFEISFAMWAAGWRVGWTPMPHVNGAGGQLSQRDRRRHQARKRNLERLQRIHALAGFGGRVIRTATDLNKQLDPIPRAEATQYKVHLVAKNLTCDYYTHSSEAW